MKVILGTDHAGYKLKEELKKFLQDEGHEVEDAGAHEYDENDDYPDFIIPAAKKVAADPESLGIVIGGSGQGEAMAANKVKGIRATIYHGGPEDLVKLTRVHNNANVLSLGARFITVEHAKKMVKLWLETKFENEERHVRRLNKINSYEK